MGCKLQTMTVAELKDALSQYPDEYEVILDHTRNSHKYFGGEVYAHTYLSELREVSTFQNLAEGVSFYNGKEKKPNSVILS